MPIMGVKDEKDLPVVDYVCFMCHLLDGLPEKEKEAVLSARIDVFPYSSAAILLDAPREEQIMRYCLKVLYKGEEPPPSLVKLMEYLSKKMVVNSIATLEERKIMGEPGGYERDGLRALAGKLKTMEKLRLFFSYDAEATAALEHCTSVEEAISNTAARTAMLNALIKVRISNSENVERYGGNAPLAGGLPKREKCKAVYIGLNTEIPKQNGKPQGFGSFEGAIMSGVWNRQSGMPVTLTDEQMEMIRNKLSVNGRGRPGPLKRDGKILFMDRMSREGLDDTLEARYARTTKSTLSGESIER